MAEIFKWEGTYDDTVADSGETIAGTGLSAGGGDGGSDTTDFDATGDRMEITGLSLSSGVLQQSSDDVLNLNQGTILLRLFFDANNVSGYHCFGYYTSAGVDYFYITYNGSGRLYLYVQDEQATPNQGSAYLSWTPTISTFYDVRITWDMDVDNSIEFSIDGASFSRTSGNGNESNVVLSDLTATVLSIGNRSSWSVYEGEISRCLISDVYRDLDLGEEEDEGNPWYYYAQQQ